MTSTLKADTGSRGGCGGRGGWNPSVFAGGCGGLRGIFTAIFVLYSNSLLSKALPSTSSIYSL